MSCPTTSPAATTPSTRIVYFAMTVHNDQVASVLRRAVQEIISRGLNDPRVRGMISVTRVRLSDDMADATVFVSVLPVEHADLTMHGLKHAGRHIRYELSGQLKMRRVPRLSFSLDDTLKKEAGVIAAINRSVRKDEKTRRAKDEDPDKRGTEP